MYCSVSARYRNTAFLKVGYLDEADHVTCLGGWGKVGSRLSFDQKTFFIEFEKNLNGKLFILVRRIV